MAEGFETRQVIDSGQQSGQSNTPSRQLGMVSVQQPRGGNMRGVGNGYRVLAEAAKMGGKVLDDYLDRKAEQDAIQGEMLYQQGKTEAELQELGVSSSTMRGFQGMKAKTAYNQWYTQRLHNIQEADHTLTPEQYRQQLGEDYSELSQQLANADPQIREMLTGLASDGFGKLVSQHTAQHAVYATQEAQRTFSDLLYSESLTGDKESLSEVVEAAEDLVPNLSKSAKKAGMASAITKSLEEGNFELFDAFGQEAGLKKRGFDDKTMKSIDIALDTAMRQRRTSTMADRLDEERGLVRQLGDGTMSPDEFIEGVTEIQERYRLDDGYKDTFVAQGIKAYVDNAGRDEDVEDKLNAGFRRDVSELVSRVKWEGLADGDYEELQKIGEKHDISADVMREFGAQLSSAQTSFETSRIQETRDLANKVKKQRQIRQGAEGLVQTSPANWIHADGAVQQEAFRIVEQEAIVRAQQDLEKLRQGQPELYAQLNPEAWMKNQAALGFAETIRHTSIIDDHLKERFEVAGAISEPLESTGELNPEIEEALINFNAMRNAGVSTAKLKDYTGDMYATLQLALRGNAVQQGEVHPRVVQRAYEAMQTDAPEPRSDPQRIQEAWKKRGREQFVKDLVNKPAWLTSLMNSDAASDSRHILHEDIKRAAESTVIDRYFMEQMQVNRKLNPMLSDSAIAHLTQQDMFDMKFIAGSILPPQNGVPVTELMGLGDMQGKMIENRAVITYVANEIAPQFEELGIPDIAPGGGALNRAWRSFRQTTLGKVGAVKISGADTDALDRLRTGAQYMELHPRGDDSVEIMFFEDSEHEMFRGSIVRPWKEIGDYYNGVMEDAQDMQYTISGEDGDTELEGGAGNDMLGVTPDRKPDNISATNTFDVKPSKKPAVLRERKTREQIKSDEGLRLNSYIDTEGHLTGGVGHLMTDAEKKKYPEGTPIPEDVVNKWFDQDMKQARKDAQAVFGKINDPDLEFVLTNMAFNLGRTRLAKFEKMKEAYDAKDYDKMADEMLDSKWARQVPNRARRLIRRIRNKGPRDALGFPKT